MDGRQRAQRNGPGGCIISPFLSVSERRGRKKTPSAQCCVNTVLGFGAIFSLQKARRTERNCTPTRTLSLQTHTSATISSVQKHSAHHCSLCQCCGDFHRTFHSENHYRLTKNMKLINEKGKCVEDFHQNWQHFPPL